MYREPSERVRAPRTRNPVACFSVSAEPGPGVMPRVLELFAKRGLTPNVWHSKLAPTGELTIDIQMNGMDAATTRYVAECMRAVCGVDCVLTAEKG